MKKVIFYMIFILFMLTGCEDFLDYPPTTGLSDDKLVDIPAMQALVYGAYGQARPFASQSALYAAGMVRDVDVRNRAEYNPFYDHQISTTMTGWMFTSGYTVLNLLNTVAVSDLEEMEGSEEEKSAIMGDMHFLRALVYFDLNNYWTLPSTGYSVPLVKEPIGPNDRVSCNTAAEIKASIEEDIELARSYFDVEDGVADYYAATALAARIYFFHENYDLAYERANEVIESGRYRLESDVALAWVPGANSKENIFSFAYNAADGSGQSPTARIFEAFQADETNGFYSLNSDGHLAQLMLADTSDARYKNFFTESPPYTYINGKYSTELMDYHYIRLPEMYLTRAESNIRVNNTVSQQDVDDINALRERANPATVLGAIPSVNDALDIIFEDRTKEMAIEMGDHYLNRRRLEKGIIKIPTEGTGLKPFSEYNELLVFPFPDNEVKIHGLTRNPE